MEFIPTPKTGFVPVRFIEGPLSRFTGSELFVGYGVPSDKTQNKSKNITRRKFILLMRKVVSLAKQNRISTLDLDFKDIRAFVPDDISDFEIGEVAGTAFFMADYEFVPYKSKPKEGFAVVATMAIRNTPEIGKEGFWKGQQIGTAVNATRTLSNTPGADMTPTLLAEAAKRAVKGTKATVKVLGKKEMQKLGMGAVLGIAKGSVEEPKFIIVEYRGGTKTQKPVVLIGKGVTFDTGGLNIKPGDGMYEMHMDMSGGAAVIQAVALAAKLKIKTNVVGLVPAVENSPSGTSVRPGDILKSLSGKTIEILNTDAEGRVILADAITYAKRFDPAVVAEASTLTGAALGALGVQASGLMSTDEKLQEVIRELGEQSGDYVWPFPLWEEYDDMVKGTFGDVPNISTAGNSRYGGVIAGGKFLEVFAKELNVPFAHLDIAPRMTAAPNEFLAKGAAGAPVRLFLKLIEHYAAHNSSHR
jgi:leucyl aminopeptidase